MLAFYYDHYASPGSVDLCLEESLTSHVADESREEYSFKHSPRLQYPTDTAGPRLVYTTVSLSLASTPTRTPSPPLGEGFGKAIAEKYIAEGAKVVIADFKTDIGEAAAKSL